MLTHWLRRLVHKFRYKTSRSYRGHLKMKRLTEVSRFDRQTFALNCAARCIIAGDAEAAACWLLHANGAPFFVAVARVFGTRAPLLVNDRNRSLCL